MRRNRNVGWVRSLVRENTLTANDLIWPVFVIDGESKVESIVSMPGVERITVDLLVDNVGAAMDLGIRAIAIFPYVNPELKTPNGGEAVNPDNLVCRAVRAIRDSNLEVGVLCDVALDPFNSDGHDGLLKDGMILNDETIEILCEQAIVQAGAGCDIIAPSDMMDGRVGAIRDALDAKGFKDVIIMSYAAKYASAFYGPFRDAIGSGGALKGDKNTYQMDPANMNEALREVIMDISEGADMVMVKPGLPYMDVISQVKESFGMPTFVYNVSGEYAMVRGAGDQGWLDYDKAVIEILTGFKRAGADGILTYHALDAARLLNG
ncbi:MAG: porphobilinogen synthase [Magnetovibrio sp.]|nr:porphobilinogen synthase [Magnetovibrio sp.]